ncbi:FAD binding domain protein [Necator americanus]|uniref:FAD binding domain protein n=1 Tax=Necator americanus TaxID=51031 RepID=W2SIR8_NECAM|nr:FAD binding domain protein [Necator americanus]ETN69549.1 FAD binding domain protein [Necator americanus]
MPKVVIAGAGLVGALNACYFAQRGWDVEVYEFRRDIRAMEHVPGRSINLALSYRGKCALEAVGLKDYIVEQGVELYARLVHNKDGKTFSRQPYGQPGEHIVSINRRHLNEVMITQAEKSQNVKFFFEHKVGSVDLDKRELLVTRTGGTKIPRFGGASQSTKESDIRVKGDLVIACDGAYSAVRRSLTTQPRFDYSQEYIEHGYIELNILPKNGEFALEPNVFHLWPRGHFTLIALANRDKTFTVTIFAPFSEFEDKMSTPNDVESFFKENFPDAYELLGRHHLLDTFNRVRPQSLVSIKCRPHQFGDFVLLAGDAAHAMVPFYGQGMNCGFEDCLVLSEALDACQEDIRKYQTFKKKLENHML